MKRSSKNLSLLLPALFLANVPFCFADDAGGKTSNGCTYKVINGQYLYDCSGKPTQNTSAPAAVPTAPAPAPVISSDNGNANVPMVNTAAPPILTFNVAPPVNQSVVNDDEESSSRSKKKSRFKDRDQFYDATYVGARLGSSTITAANAGSAVGLGISVGTNLDDFLGIELGYSYTKQDMNLGLNSRSGGTSLSNAKDSSLSAHLLSAEIQFHLTDTFKRLRPYAGVGLGWKHSTLTDNGSPAAYPYINAASTGGALSQSSLGAVTSLGTKFRVTDTWLAAVAFRYYLPMSNQSANLSSPQTGSTSSTNRLSQADSNYTSSSIYELVGGVQYAF